MPKESLVKVVRRRTMGVVFLAVVAAFIAFSIAIYNKSFTSYTDISVQTDSIGNQLQPASDVKIRGLIVGSVDSISSNGSVDTVKLHLFPDQVSKIPSNATAEILPKTLFGEQYVALQIPTNPKYHIEAGAVIPQNRSKGALEAQKVLADLYPLLTAVQPAQLNATLTALAQALANNGDKLGQTLVDSDKYLKQLNATSGTGKTYTSQIVDDLGKLGHVALEYNGVSPDLFSSLRNMLTGARTVVAKQRQLSNLLTAGSTASQTLASFLAENKERTIAVSGQTSTTFNLLNEYSPEFSCLFSGINTLYSKVGKVIYGGSIHLSATPDTEKSQSGTKYGAYKPGEQPKIITGYGPACFGLPSNVGPLDGNGNFQIPSKYVCLNDGAWLSEQGANGQCSGKANNGATSSSASDDPITNSPAENAMINSLISGQLGTTPDKVSGTATLLAGPLLRGQHVVVGK